MRGAKNGKFAGLRKKKAVVASSAELLAAAGLAALVSEGVQAKEAESENGNDSREHAEDAALAAGGVAELTDAAPSDDATPADDQPAGDLAQAAAAGDVDELIQELQDALKDGSDDDARFEPLKVAAVSADVAGEQVASDAVGDAGAAGDKVSAEDAEKILEKDPTAFGFVLPAFAPLLGLGAAAGAAAAGLGGGAGATVATSKVSGTVVDGPVKGATVFYDANGNGVLDAGEASTTSDLSGKFSLAYTPVSGGRLVSVGGNDLYTGKAVGWMTAPDGATVITPLTSLIAGGISQEELKAKLGISADIDLLKYDPFAVLDDPNATPAQIYQAEAIAEISQKLFAIISAAAVNKVALRGDGSVDLAHDITSADFASIVSGVIAAIHNAPVGASLLDIVKDATVAAVAASEGLDISVLLDQIHAGADVTSYFTDSASMALVNAIIGVTNSINFSNLNAALDAYHAGNVHALDAIVEEVSAVQASLLTIVQKIAGGDATLVKLLIDSGGNVAQIDSIIASFSGSAGQTSVIDLVDGTITLSESDAQELIAKGVHFADDDDKVTLSATGPTLNIPVAALQVLGVDAVTSSTSALSATLGDANLGAALPKFDSSLDVTLGVTDGQVGDVLTTGHAQALAAAGVDVIHALDGTLSVTSSELDAANAAHLSFAQSDVVTLSASADDLTHLYATVTDPGSELQSLHVDVIDLTGNGNFELSDAQAQGLVSAGVHFAADDNIGVHAAGTVLSTSVAALQALGVDSVAGDHGALHVTLGNADLGSSLPHFANGLDVTLSVTDAQVGDVLTSAHAAALTAAGVDAIHANDGTLTVTADEFAAADGAHLGFAQSDAVTLSASADDLTHLYATTADLGSEMQSLHVDVIDLTGNGNFELSDAQAQGLVSAGLHFAADDNIGVHAAGTVLSTSVAALQTLGVDSVAADHDVLHVTLGNADLGSALPHFADGLSVTLGVTDDQLANALTTQHAQILHDAGIDQIHAQDGTLTVDIAEFTAAQHAGLTFASSDVVTLNGSANDISHLGDVVDHPGDAIQAMHVDVIDLTDPSLTISDSVAQEMLAGGVHFAANDVIDLHAAGTTLHTSLHDMQKLGVDTVDGVHNGNLHIDLGSGVTLDDVAHQTLPDFDTATHTNVDLQVHQDQLAGSTLADIAAIEKSGVDEITVLDTANHAVASASITDHVAETTTAFEVSDELAAVLVNAGLISGAQDNSKPLDVNIESHTGESALSLVMMGDLGVDHVSSTSADVLVHLGFDPTTHQDADLQDLVAALAKLGDGAHSVFDSGANVTLDLGSNTHFADLTSDEDHKLKLLGIDKVSSDGQTHNLS